MQVVTYMEELLLEEHMKLSKLETTRSGQWRRWGMQRRIEAKHKAKARCVVRQCQECRGRWTMQDVWRSRLVILHYAIQYHRNDLQDKSDEMSKAWTLNCFNAMCRREVSSHMIFWKDHPSRDRGTKKGLSVQVIRLTSPQIVWLCCV